MTGRGDEGPGCRGGWDVIQGLLGCTRMRDIRWVEGHNSAHPTTADDRSSTATPTVACADGAVTPSNKSPPAPVNRPTTEAPNRRCPLLRTTAPTIHVHTPTGTHRKATAGGVCPTDLPSGAN